MSFRPIACLLAVCLLAAACGAKRPVLYPNPTYREIGEADAEATVDHCLDQAHQADIADSRTRGAAKRGTAGAVFGALLWGTVGWIFGNPGRGAAAGAAAGGGSGAVQGAVQSGEGDRTFRAYVEACLREHDLQSVGWK